MSRMCRRCGNAVVERDAEPWGRGFAHREPPGCPTGLSLSPRVRRRCENCGGDGYVELVGGMGELIPRPCPDCNGTGNIWEDR